jgi:plastocyanin
MGEKLHREFTMVLNRRRLLTATVAFSAFAASARAAQTVRVRIPAARTAFEPKEVTIKVGDTVEWTNRSVVMHTVTCDPAKPKDKTNVALPTDAQPFDSGEMGEDAVFKHTFKSPGTYKYLCVEHESMGMVGAVIVQA